MSGALNFESIREKMKDGSRNYSGDVLIKFERREMLWKVFLDNRYKQVGDRYRAGGHSQSLCRRMNGWEMVSLDLMGYEPVAMLLLQTGKSNTSMDERTGLQPALNTMPRIQTKPTRVLDILH